MTDMNIDSRQRQAPARVSDIDDRAVSEAKRRIPRAFQATAKDRAIRYAIVFGFVAIGVYGIWAFDVTIERFWIGLGRLGHVLSFMFPPYVWPTWELAMEPITAIGETLAMAFLGTLFATLMAIPLSFLGAKNINRFEASRFVVRRGFDFIRAFEQLVLALIFIRAFGLGPLAGIAAIAVSDTGSLAKLFAEAIENVDKKPMDGVKASGAGRFQIQRLAVIPQVWPVMLSLMLYTLESNTRSATILGIVGAGGIGYMLFDRIGANNWQEVMSIILLILITVYVIDAISRELRLRIIGRR